jgi:ferredoxin-type protein NapH
MVKLKIEPIRLLSQLILVSLLNFTVVGSIYIAPFLPVLRLDIPLGVDVPGIYEHGQIRACPMASFQRGLTGTWELAFFFMVLAGMAVVALIVGRALCGWACPFGLVQDMISRLRDALGIRAREFPENVHRNLSNLRFVILGLFILLSSAIGISVLGSAVAGDVFKSYLPEGICQTAPYCATCPTPSLFYVLRVLTFQEPLGIGDPVHISMWFILGLLTIGSFLQPRFFCRYVCPTGALSSPFNRISLLHIEKDMDRCTKCNVCFSNCPTRVKEVREKDCAGRIKDAGCIFCGECVQRCPDRALRMKLGPFNLYKGGPTWFSRYTGRKAPPKNKQ